FDLDFLAGSGLSSRFGAIVLSCDTGILKPDPRAFHAAASALGLPPGQILMVGDNFRDDVLGAREAGMSSILIRRSGVALSHREPPDDEECIEDLDDLERLLRSGA